MSRKHIIVSGCSVSSDDTSTDIDERDNSISKNYKSYPHYLKENEFKVTNLSQSGLDNASISRMIIYRIHKLIKNGAKIEDIFVLIQWSGIDRASCFVTKEETIDYDDLWKFNFVDNSKNAKWTVNRGKSGKYYWEEYFNAVHTEEGFFIKTLENILKTQWFLKENNINYKMFTGWDIFTFNPGKDGGYGTNHKSGGQFFSDKIYKNKDNILLKDEFKNSSYLWDMIDFDNFLTFNNNNIKFGGILQWVQSNLKKEDWFRDSENNDFHPSNIAQNNFCEKVLIPAINKN